MNHTPVSANPIEVLQQHSLTTLVQRELERRILAGLISPGEKLNEASVADQLNVSRGPVREAFRALEQAGLLRTEKNRGVFVRELSLQDADEIYEVRAGLEQQIGRLSAERVTPAQLEELRELLKAMQKAARARNVDDYYPLNFRFHDLLAQFAGNRTLLGIYRRLVNELHLYRRETLAHGPDSFPVSTREHAQIVDCLARADGEAAAHLLYSHAIESRERLHATLEKPAAGAKRPRGTTQGKPR
jgi:phosphonate utilization transcriptional regulator